jgi:acyl carrier protein
MTPMNPHKTLVEIETMLVTYVAQKTGLAEVEVDRGRRFDYYGFDSTDAVMLVGELEDFVGRQLSAALPYSYPTITGLARRLADGGSE